MKDLRKPVWLLSSYSHARLLCCLLCTEFHSCEHRPSVEEQGTRALGLLAGASSLGGCGEGGRAEGEEEGACNPSIVDSTAFLGQAGA